MDQRGTSSDQALVAVNFEDFGNFDGSHFDPDAIQFHEESEEEISAAIARSLQHSPDLAPEQREGRVEVFSLTSYLPHVEEEKSLCKSPKRRRFEKAKHDWFFKYVKRPTATFLRPIEEEDDNAAGIAHTLILVLKENFKQLSRVRHRRGHLLSHTRLSRYNNRIAAVHNNRVYDVVESEEIPSPLAHLNRPTQISPTGKAYLQRNASSPTLIAPDNSEAALNCLKANIAEDSGILDEMYRRREAYWRMQRQNDVELQQLSLEQWIYWTELSKFRFPTKKFKAAVKDSIPKIAPNALREEVLVEACTTNSRSKLENIKHLLAGSETLVGEPRTKSWQEKIKRVLK
jgi:hypothetical protein